MEPKNEVQEARWQFFGRVETRGGGVDSYVQGKPLNDISFDTPAPGNSAI